ncbi:LysR family transcriptional regulator [Undibacterium sp. Ji42W]|uniref:LysR family transcriptional regulator n=1 Tax=Undibacterium sp. Ji42W TaxID=3413039 RepID=UPI003BF3DC4D
MNLSQLRFASAIASTGSFTAAAQECCVTQPTLSNGIAQLESELGERLFVRTTRKVALTPFGVHVLPYINEVLGAQTSLVHQTRMFHNPGKRLIRIGTSPLISANLLGLMIEPFRLRNLDIDVVLREMNMTDLYRMLDKGLLDFVFGVAHVHKGPWDSTFLYEESLIFIPRGTMWQGDTPRHSVQLKDIANETYVMVPDACGLSRATRAMFRSQRRKLQEYSGEAMSYKVLEEWAALGIGSAILPKSKVTVSGSASFPITDKSGRELTISFEATWSRAGTKPPHLLDFAKHLCKVAPGTVAGLHSGTKR